MARPKKITKDVVQKLEDAFLKGLSDNEACIYAGIAKQTLYNYCAEKPGFLDRKEMLKDGVKMRAKMNIAKEIENGDVALSKWYLVRKCRDEFSDDAAATDNGLNITIGHSIPRPKEDEDGD